MKPVIYNLRLLVISVLRSLSAVGRSQHAVELEKRAIHLLLEEGNSAIHSSQYVFFILKRQIIILSDQYVPFLHGSQGITSDESSECSGKGFAE